MENKENETSISRAFRGRPQSTNTFWRSQIAIKFACFRRESVWRSECPTCAYIRRTVIFGTFRAVRSGGCYSLSNCRNTFLAAANLLSFLRERQHQPCPATCQGCWLFISPKTHGRLLIDDLYLPCAAEEYLCFLVLTESINQIGRKMDYY